MAGRTLRRDQRGAVTSDWVALVAGVAILGLIVAFSVMENSSGYLMDEFETLNAEYEDGALALSELSTEPAPER